MLRKIGVLMLATVMAFSFALTVNGENSVARQELIPESSKTMNNTTQWYSFSGATISYRDETLPSGQSDKVLVSEWNNTATWSSPAIELYPILSADVKKNGSGRFQLSFLVKAEEYSEEGNVSISPILRSTCYNNVSSGVGGGAYLGGFGSFATKLEVGKWYKYSSTFCILESDLGSGDESWFFCFDGIKAKHMKWCIDDFSIVRISDNVNNTAILDATVEEGTKFDGAKAPAATPEPSKNGLQVNDSNTEKVNLLKSEASTFETQDIASTGWSAFSGGMVSLTDQGYTGRGLAFSGGTDTWHSPSLNVRPYITEAGQYSLRLNVKYTGGNEINNLVMIIRTQGETAFSKQHGNNFYGDINKSLAVARDEWQTFVCTFTVDQKDLEDTNAWNLCISRIETGVTAVYVDEVYLIKGTKDGLSEINSETYLAVADEEKKDDFYPKDVTKAAITAGIVTFVITGSVIALKIVIDIRKRKNEK